MRSTPKGLKQEQRPTLRPSWTARSVNPGPSCSAHPRSLGGPGVARARRDLSNAHCMQQIHAGWSKSMGRGWGGSRQVRNGVPCVFGMAAFTCVACVRVLRRSTSLWDATSGGLHKQNHAQGGWSHAALGPSCAQPAPRRLRQTGIFISTRNQWRDSARELHYNPDATFAGVCVPLRILPPRCAQWPPHLRRLGTQPDGRPLSATSEPVCNPPGPLCPAAGTAHPGERALRCRSQSPVGDTVPICMRKQSQEQGAWSHTPREPPRAGATARPCRIDFDRPV